MIVVYCYIVIVASEHNHPYYICYHRDGFSSAQPSVVKYRYKVVIDTSMVGLSRRLTVYSLSSIVCIVIYNHSALSIFFIFKTSPVYGMESTKTKETFEAKPIMRAAKKQRTPEKRGETPYILSAPIDK